MTLVQPQIAIQDFGHLIGWELMKFHLRSMRFSSILGTFSQTLKPLILFTLCGRLCFLIILRKKMILFKWFHIWCFLLAEARICKSDIISLRVFSLSFTLLRIRSDKTKLIFTFSCIQKASLRVGHFSLLYLNINNGLVINYLQITAIIV